MTRYFASTQVSGDELEPVRWNILGTVQDDENAAMVVYKPEGGGVAIQMAWCASWSPGHECCAWNVRATRGELKIRR